MNSTLYWRIFYIDLVYICKKLTSNCANFHNVVMYVSEYERRLTMTEVKRSYIIIEKFHRGIFPPPEHILRFSFFHFDSFFYKVKKYLI